MVIFLGMSNNTNVTYCKWFTVAKLFVQQFWTLIIRSDCRIRAVYFTQNDHILFHILYLDTLETLPELKSQIFCPSACIAFCVWQSVQRTGTLTWQSELTLLSSGEGFEPRDRPVLLCFWVMWCEKPGQMQ